jgi:hypothetical protein
MTLIFMGVARLRLWPAVRDSGYSGRIGSNDVRDAVVCDALSDRSLPSSARPARGIERKRGSPIRVVAQR